jgi:undecaprenyl-diphosphatase
MTHFTSNSVATVGWDVDLFHAIHSATAPSSVMLTWARCLADGPVLLAAGVLVVMLVQRQRSIRVTALNACEITAIALIVNLLIGFVWSRPRPFIAGVGQAWIMHAPTSSFRSDHLTSQWVIAGMLLRDRRTRLWGIGLALLGLPMAWARIYLGLHYPSDMLGAAVLAILATSMSARWRPEQQRFTDPDPGC